MPPGSIGYDSADVDQDVLGIVDGWEQIRFRALTQVRVRADDAVTEASRDARGELSAQVGVTRHDWWWQPVHQRSDPSLSIRDHAQEQSSERDETQDHA